MGRIKLQVLGLSYSMSQVGTHALIMADEKDVYRIPVVIGAGEAHSISMQLEKIQPLRPLTHDLIKTLTSQLKVNLKEVYIYRLEYGIFYSELSFETPSEVIKIDSRTSDAIALALRYGCDIYTTPEIMQRAGIPVNHYPWDPKQPMSNEHVGRDSPKEDTVQELNTQLNAAIKNEDYERASHLRDLIKKKTEKGEISQL